MGACLFLLFCLAPASFPWTKARTVTDPQQLRNDYVARVQQMQAPTHPADANLGSLWDTGGLMADLAADYKAHRVNDTISIVVLQQTTAQASGAVDSERSFNTTSGISGVAGKLKTGGINPLLTAQSATTLKGKGSADTSSLLQTTLTGQVVAVLPNGNLVVEAQRMVAVNSQKETMIVRGVLRPGDVGPDNSAFSTSLSNLEIELKGKGVISDATRPINPILRALLWVIGF